MKGNGRLSVEVSRVEFVADEESAHWFCCFEVLENVLISSNGMSSR